jgi:hypothetical protein
VRNYPSNVNVILRPHYLHVNNPAYWHNILGHKESDI